MAMKQINVAEATGPALDWLVATAEQRAPSLHEYSKGGGDWYVLMQTGVYRTVCAFSTAWAQGGPIIDREDIFFSPLPDMGLRAFQFKDGQYLNIVDCWPYKEQLTRLVLGMRCYVASKLGDTAEVPEELL